MARNTPALKHPSATSSGSVTSGSDYGIYRVKLDGRDVGTFDLLNPNVQPTPHKLGMHSLAAGPHPLRFECAGKAEKSKGYFFGFDVLTARVPVYARPANKDLRELQARPEPK
jgi:hypothetical protein